MPVSLTFNPDQSRTLDRRVSRVDVEVGSLLITPTDSPTLVSAGDSYDAQDAASLTLYAPNGANATIVYTDEVEAPAIRGDSGGTGGSYESRTLTELRKLATEREIPGRSKMDKDALIEALRS